MKVVVLQKKTKCLSKYGGESILFENCFHFINFDVHRDQFLEATFKKN